MDTLNCRDAVWLPSVTLIVNPNWPVAVGVPLSVPFEASVRPGGRYVNGASVHVSAPVPPVAVNVFVYAVPTCPVASVEVPFIEIVVTFSVNCRAAEAMASCALMRKVYLPDTVGVPVRTPADVRVTPAGKDPP